MKQLRQTGFGTVEAIIIGVILFALAGISLWVFKQQSDSNSGKNGVTELSQGEDITTPEAPGVESIEDLKTAEKALDEINLEVGNSDNAELDVQSSNF